MNSVESMKMLEGIEKTLSKAKEEFSKLTGKLESANEDLKKLGYATTELAIKDINKLDDEAEGLEKEFDELMDEFKEKYPDLVST
jgi:predicted nuclease with TOPRIM domain